MPQRRFYFDYAASTPVAPEVERAMRPYFLKKFGNAGSLHSFGQEASSAMDSSRETIAKALGANFREVIFTGSATEANNLAIRGIVKGFRVKGMGYSKKNSLHPNPYTLTPRIIVSAIEHESVLETARDLEKDGVEVIYLPVDRNGIVQLDELKSALDERTVLVSIMYANNEIGTIQPISEIAKIISDFRKGLGFRVEGLEKGKKLTPNPYTLCPLFHTDAVQALQFLDCDVNKLGVDMLTLSSHKIYGPKGVGALYVKNLESRNQKIEINNKKILNSKFYFLDSLITGGGQEFGLRSGTENIPSIVGFAKAIELTVASRNSEFQKIKKLKDYFWNGILNICSQAELNGGLSTNNESETNKRIQKFETHSKFADVLPNILNVYFPDYEAEYLLTKFDLAGIAVSAGSACSARSAQPSYVITALGYSEKRAKHSIRFSFGRPTAKKDIDSAIGVIRKLL